MKIVNVKYDPSTIEPKWQRVWEENSLYRTSEPTKGSHKKYILDMYPYPSGAVLHVGHMEGYVGTDVVSRYLRMKGFAVLHPMGWDAFGLPAENYAIKTGVPPDESTHKNIDTFRKQLKMLGLSYDWEREIDTSSPDYYKWTQWLFILLFKMGLAYKKKAPANWCSSCETVLANEQVVDGKCERCGTEVIQKDLDQWFFKITAYADALIDGLGRIDWPKSTKLMQKNWIGRSEGVNLKHKVRDLGIEFEVYDSVPQTFMAQTFVVIAPEHPLVEKLVKGTEYEKPVMEFVEKIRRKKSKGKFDVEKEKEGVFTGRYSQNYMNTGRDLPIWVASFVLMDYGTGIVGSSAHDERDFVFAKKYNLPLKPVLFPEDKELAKKVRDGEVWYREPDGILEEPEEFKGMRWDEARGAIIDYIGQSKFGTRTTNYHLRDWLVSRQRYWGAPIPMVFCQSCADKGVGYFNVKRDVRKAKQLNSSIADSYLAIKQFSNGVAMAGWFPVPENQLPIKLPTDVDFLPHGESPIARSKTFQKGVKCPSCGGEARQEVDTMDTFVDSSWYFLAFACASGLHQMISDKSDRQSDNIFARYKREIETWMPVDIYVGGGHTVQHLLFARFFQKALVDAGLIAKDMDEPFLRLEVPGWILGPDFRKMSKRWNNVITPDEVIKQYGADTMRLYEMFMAPFEVDKPWNVDSVAGVHRFVNRIYGLFCKTEADRDLFVSIGLSDLLNVTIGKVGSDIETFNFNTAVSGMMELVNAMEKAVRASGLKPQGKMSWRELWRNFLLILAPFAPHLAEELWFKLGHKTSVHVQSWPETAQSDGDAEEVTIVVSVNGKPRTTKTFSRQEARVLEEKYLVQMLQSDERMSKFLTGGVTRVVYVPGKIINFVTV